MKSVQQHINDLFDEYKYLDSKAQLDELTAIRALCCLFDGFEKIWAKSSIVDSYMEPWAYTVDKYIDLFAAYAHYQTLHLVSLGMDVTSILECDEGYDVFMEISELRGDM